MTSELSEVRSNYSTSKVINSSQVSGQYKKRQEMEVWINQLLIILHYSVVITAS